MADLGAMEGVFACPEGAATLVGLRRLLEEDFFKGDETIILMNTGSGLKYLDLVKGST
jgi:threonine synthase